MKVVVRNNLAYLADYHNGLIILDVSEPANPLEVGKLENGDQYLDWWFGMTMFIYLMITG